MTFDFIYFVVSSSIIYKFPQAQNYGVSKLE